jgi:thiol-disulfide isomerase/thioredoxin
MTNALTRYGIPLLLAIGVAGFLYVLFAASSKPSADKGLERFRTASLAKLELIPNPPAQPRNSFVDAEGNSLTLADFRGKVIVVNLWATWCPPCIAELPTLAALQQAYSSDRFEVVAISLDRLGDREAAIEDLEKFSGGSLRFLHEPSYGIAFDMQAVGLPMTVIYDAEGIERARLPGEAKWDSPEAKGLVETLLSR